MLEFVEASLLIPKRGKRLGFAATVDLCGRCVVPSGVVFSRIRSMLFTFLETRVSELRLA